MLSILNDILLRKPRLRLGAIWLLIALLGYIDLITGYEYSFAVFYLAPVSLAAWYERQAIAIWVTLACTLMWLTADIYSGHTYTYAITPFWNAATRGGFFTVVALLLIRVKQNWLALKQMALYDALTSLLNPRALTLQYPKIAAISQLKKLPCALGVIDLDGFKAVNDQYGHLQGDQILIEFAQLLKNSLRRSDLCARLGGDEFVIVLIDVTAEQVKLYNNRLRQLVQQSILKTQFKVDFSMGMVLFNPLPDTLQHATHQADLLMYQAKNLGKCQTVLDTATAER